MKEDPIDTITIPEAEEILFKADLETQEQEVGLTKGEGSRESDLTLIGGKHNRIAIGRPFSQRLTTKSKHITPDVKRLMEKNDFYLLSLSCSFLPDMGCKFRWAQLGILLHGTDKDGAQGLEKPIELQIGGSWNRS
jgi:hypothetical protein